MTNVYEQVSKSECCKQTGKAPLGVRWIDVNKHDEKYSMCKSSLVAKDYDNSQEFPRRSVSLVTSPKGIFGQRLRSSRSAPRNCKLLVSILWHEASSRKLVEVLRRGATQRFSRQMDSPHLHLRRIFVSHPLEELWCSCTVTMS